MGTFKTIIIVGAGYGGLHAAASARRCNEDARIIVIDYAESRFMSPVFRQELFCKHHNVEFRRGKIHSLDPDAHCLNLISESGLERIPYDSFIFAGAIKENSAGLSEIAGLRIKQFFELQAEMLDELSDQGMRRALVVGCGINGIETALKLRRADIDVTIIEKKKRILSEFSLELSQAILSKLEKEGVKVVLGDCIIDGVVDEHGHATLTRVHGDAIEVDMVVVAAGVVPDVSLLAKAGAALDVSGLVRVDDHMETTIPRVFACGSAIKVPVVRSDERKWLYSSSVWLTTGRIAGVNAATSSKETLKPFGQTLVMEVGGTRFARTGLSEFEARKAFGDNNVLVVTLYTNGCIDGQPINSIRLLINRETEIIVGGEVFGLSDVEGRISLLSVAVMENWSPQDLLDVDTAFASTDASLLDPLKEAALRAKFLLATNTPVVSAETLALWLKTKQDFRLVDVSDALALSGRQSKHVMHLPLESLRARALELASDDTPIVVYASCGEESDLAQRALMHRGVPNVFSLEGGLATFNMVLAKE